MHAPAPQRLLFLDWLRILAFFILVLYHVGMYYVSWDWHVKSDAIVPGLDAFMLLSAPWRLGLLFLVAGAAGSMALARLGAGAFVRRRSLRLLLPLAFGVLVVVPPQSWFEVLEDVGYEGGYLRFLGLFLSGYGGFCDQDGCLSMPAWNHLWFLPYLWAYSLVLAAIATGAGLAAFAGPRPAALARALAGCLQGWKLLVLPAACLALARATLLLRFGETHMFYNDAFNHATYLFLFLLGALCAHAPECWPRFTALRWQALGIAATGWAAIVLWRALFARPLPGVDPMAWFPLMAAVHATTAWCAIVAACGFAARHLDRDGPARRYLTAAVFPVYIVHQTLIVTLAHTFKPLKLGPGVEATVLVVLTLTLSFAVFECVRRSALLRPLFGMPRGLPRGMRAALPLQKPPAQAAATSGPGQAGGRTG